MPPPQLHAAAEGRAAELEGGAAGAAGETEYDEETAEGSHSPQAVFLSFLGDTLPVRLSFRAISIFVVSRETIVSFGVTDSLS